ncbi:undecaprenyldiphospho-muramoylpentapeptide beta-N-acetylglucosaminyltransferase [Paenibacillus marinisediminis]
MTKRILFTGGGSAGHVTVNQALIPHFIHRGWQVNYMGSHQGIEAQLMKQQEQVRYVGISTGKWRRYKDMENIKDPFRVMKGIMEAYRHIRAIQPDVVFSKGGFVSVPVVLGAWLNRIPVIIHESDITPGLANRISIPFAAKVCATFPEVAASIHKNKAVHVGAIIREQLRHGQTSRGYAYCGFTSSKPVILIMGGSLGAQRINQAIRNNLDHLLQNYQIIHICGKGQMDTAIQRYGYLQVEYIQDELPDLLAITEMVISRAGSNSIFEFLSLRKPMLLIPLSREASRGDQILNAESFKAAGYCDVLLEEHLTDSSLLEAIRQLEGHKDSMIEKMSHNDHDQAIDKVIDMIINVTN